jgi:LysM repeat protein
LVPKRGAVVKGEENFELLLSRKKGSDRNAVTTGESNDPERWIRYTIKPGDTLWSLAVKRFHVHLQDLMRDKGIDDPRKLRPGQTVFLKHYRY